MAQTFAEVSWFRFFVVVSISVLASMMFNLEDDWLSGVEIARTVIQGLIAGVAFLQCPSITPTARTVKPEAVVELAQTIKQDATALEEIVQHVEIKPKEGE
ncbi:MAG: hypothetical protein M3367_15645 [Acidobacteriota bacterium]|nr:hypothetical protein [Acidobacteriota bacterium]